MVLAVSGDARRRSGIVLVDTRHFPQLDVHQIVFLVPFLYLLFHH